VRGYSQLLILKALMDKVEAIERSRPLRNGKKVDSSFDPIPWPDVPLTSAERLRRQKSTATRPLSSSGSTILNSGIANGKAKEKEQEPGKEKSRFYPHHYFDWIAGTSTGGSVESFQPILQSILIFMDKQAQCNHALTTSHER
jgi:hypothetical protein